MKPSEERAALEWAKHRQDSYKCKADKDLAAAYLELRELAKVVLDSDYEPASKAVAYKKALRAAIGEEP